MAHLLGHCLHLCYEDADGACQIVHHDKQIKLFFLRVFKCTSGKIKCTRTNERTRKEGRKRKEAQLEYASLKLTHLYIDDMGSLRGKFCLLCPLNPFHAPSRLPFPIDSCFS